MNHLDHMAPLRHLVKQLHRGRSLRDNVVRLRWRRRKQPKPAETVAEPEEAP